MITVIWMLALAAACWLAASLLWDDLHTCRLPGCDAWTPQTGPGRLCPAHRAQQYSDLERHWADTDRRSA